MNFVADGEILLALNSQFPREMGAGAMNAALKAIKGEKIGEYVQLTPTKVFTTVDRLAIDKWISER
jgi:ABC-type sugar transport system substrate-binding protein